MVNKMPELDASTWTDKKLFLVFVAVFSVAPFVLNAFGVDFSSHVSSLQDAFEATGSPLPLIDRVFHSLSGSFTHTILEWSAFCAAFFTACLAFVHFLNRKDVATPVLAVAVLCAGSVDAFHTLAADRLIEAVADNQDLIPFTWAISRVFGAVILTVGVLVCLKKDKWTSNPLFVFIACAGLGTLAYVIIHYTAASSYVPQTTFPDSFITRPYDVVPLMIYPLLAFYLIPRLHRQENTFFTYALLLSMIPEAATQAHMAFGSTALFDNHFNIAHFLKIGAYATPFVGLLLDYRQTIKTESAINLALSQSNRHKQEALNDLEQQQFALDQHADVTITDLAGNITFCNDKFVDITGYTRQELIGANHRLLKSGLHDDEFFADMYRTITSGQVWRGEICNKTKDGRLLWMESTIVPFKNKDGKPQSYIAIRTDTTERRHAEEKLCTSVIALEEQQEALQQAQKMEAMGTLAGGIAHDFNNLLGAILGYNELAQLEMSKEGKTSKHLERIHAAGTRAKTLVMQILNFSRKSDRKLAPVSIEEIVEEVISDIRMAKSSNIDLRKHVEEEIGCVMADPAEVHRVIMNLCKNAMQAMEQAGGTLCLDLDTVEVSSDFANQHLVLKGRVYIRLTVRDTGYGISESNLSRVFDPFFTTKDVGEGTGLGLTMVHDSVKSMGGAISVHSAKGKGTTFFVYFPQTDESSKQHTELSETPSGSGQRVMVVDDEELLATMCATMLGQLNYTVTTFTSSTDALKAFYSTPNSFDIIVTDQRMPDITGSELTYEIHQLRPNIPVILVTGFSEEVDCESAASFGFSDYLPKPYTKKELAKSLNRIFEETTATGHPPS